ncbi:hypothetical protein GCM10018775_63520 [Streptomyces umbrinus]|nr:hypothetical protein GCM10018775_63520 [Streptomyces umbrinus]
MRAGRAGPADHRRAADRQADRSVGVFDSGRSEGRKVSTAVDNLVTSVTHGTVLGGRA